MASVRSRFRFVPLLAAVALVASGCSGRDSFSAPVPEIPAATVPIEMLEDPRLAELLDAARVWRESRGPGRAVVDQVVLVDDAASFFSALAGWDRDSFHPILIDDPRWTVPFLKAFRPAAIVRWSSFPRRRFGGPLDEWAAASDAVARAWVEDGPGRSAPPSSALRPRELGPTPPGVVLSHPGSPALAGAAALAAGRFQPLVGVDRIVAEDRVGFLDFHATLTEKQAVAFARDVEARAATVARRHDGLGDDVDFLTLAGDWPYGYDFDRGSDLNRGVRAVDDLLGRALAPGTELDVDAARARWAYAGRLLGDAPTSVYRAMAALFLQPDSALLWNTYGVGSPWSDYDVAGAATVLRSIRPDFDVEARGGDRADLASWHEAARGGVGRDLLVMNSSGEPGRFTIAGGSGVPADVPFGGASTVAMIHSFSAADPTDPDTIAGRFLDRGAFVYHGSMNEPYLNGFRPPYLLARLAVAGVPLGAAARQGAREAFGFPWRLVYLGDPLYRVDVDPDRSRRPSPAAPPPGARLLSARPRPDSDDAAETLDWCYDATLLAVATLGDAGTPDVLEALSNLDRGRLDAGRRAKLDALLIERSTAAGDVSGLIERLLGIPVGERSPTVWRALETAVLDELAARLRANRLDEALNLWGRIASGSWRPGADFPGEATRRLADSVTPARAPALRRAVAEVRDRLAASNALPERREMLEETLRKLDKYQAP